MHDEEMRERFEAWARSQTYPCFIADDGVYDAPSTRSLWGAWQAATAAAQQERARDAQDTARLYWIGNLFKRSWNGVIGIGSRYEWTLHGDWRHHVQGLVGNDFRAAIDAAMAADRER